MSKVIVNIQYGEESIENIIDKIIKEKINEVTRNIKKGEIARYNNIVNKDLSTNCKEKQEVVK